MSDNNFTILSTQCTQSTINEEETKFNFEYVFKMNDDSREFYYPTDLKEFLCTIANSLPVQDQKDDSMMYDIKTILKYLCTDIESCFEYKNINYFHIFDYVFGNDDDIDFSGIWSLMGYDIYINNCTYDDRSGLFLIEIGVCERRPGQHYQVLYEYLVNNIKQDIIGPYYDDEGNLDPEEYWYTSNIVIDRLIPYSEEVMKTKDLDVLKSHAEKYVKRLNNGVDSKVRSTLKNIENNATKDFFATTHASINDSGIFNIFFEYEGTNHVREWSIVWAISKHTNVKMRIIKFFNTILH